MIIISSPSAQLALHSLDYNPSLTINAEYGAYVAQGKLYTSANHQPSGSQFTNRFNDPEHGRPAPCNDQNIPTLDDLQVALIKDIDLPTLGGLLRASGYDLQPQQDFWNLVEVYDLYPDETSVLKHPRYQDLIEVEGWLLEKTPKSTQNQNLTDFFYYEAIPFMLSLGLLTTTA